MPLDRHHVTTASRVMLPTYPAFFACVGVSFVATPDARLATTPALGFAADLMPLTLWGAGFLAVAAILTGALLVHRRAVYRAALAAAFVWMVAWALVLLIAAFDSSTSFSAWTWPAFIAAACLATLRSLAAGER